MVTPTTVDTDAEVPTVPSNAPPPQPSAAATEIPSNDLEAASYQFPKMHPEGTKFVVIAAAITLIFWLLGWEILGWLMAGITVWVFAFFRDPQRVTPEGDDKIVSPADGMVSHIVTVAPPRQLAASGLLEGERYTRVSVFMSVFDVHVNRAPVAGKISRIVYVPGKFLNAETDKASEDNERQYFVIERADGTMIGMTQIAGLVARRIVKFVREGQGVEAGERVGLIRFGSRVDVFLPEGYVPNVAIGQRAVAGETVLAQKGGERVRGMLR
ncbi:MAG: phosphatidylserine decarboxylase [Pacificimonas sp.]